MGLPIILFYCILSIPIFFIFLIVLYYIYLCYYLTCMLVFTHEDLHYIG